MQKESLKMKQTNTDPTLRMTTEIDSILAIVTEIAKLGFSGEETANGLIALCRIAVNMHDSKRGQLSLCRNGELSMTADSPAGQLTLTD